MRLVPVLRRHESPARFWPDTTTLFDSLFKDWPFSGSLFEREAGMPAVDILEKDGNWIFRAELPGMDEKDIDLKLEGNILILRGERKLEDEDRRDSYHRMERYHGSFSRSFTLPETADLDKIKADYKNGVLVITIPQKPETKPREIPVRIN